MGFNRIKRQLSNEEYGAAEERLAEYLEDELTGKGIIPKLNGYIQDYEKILIELKSDLVTLSHDKPERRPLLLINQCREKANNAKVTLEIINKNIAELKRNFRE
jgi:hypothetical protein